MQNLKGEISLFLAPQGCPVDGGVSITEQTSWRLEEAYATLTLMENNIFRVPDTNDSSRESFHLLLGYI